MLYRFSAPAVRCLTLVALLAAFAAPAVRAASPGPQAFTMPPAEPVPQDTPYAPGPIALNVDLTDVAHRILNVEETIPVEAGPLTLFYPRWLPGNHEPSGPISRLAGLAITSGGGSIAWRRDPVDVFAFHVDVPKGTRQLHVSYQYLEPLRSSEGRVSASDSIIDLQWNTVVLYPAGQLPARSSTSPPCACPARTGILHQRSRLSTQEGPRYAAQTPLNTLVDSPLYTGLYSKRIDLSTDAGNKVYLDLFGDSDDVIAIDAGPGGALQEPHHAGAEALRVAPLFALRLPLPHQRPAWGATDWSTTSAAKTAHRPETSASGPRACPTATCCP